jgi:hypothetical protein
VRVAARVPRARQAGTDATVAGVRVATGDSWIRSALNSDCSLLTSTPRSRERRAARDCKETSSRPGTAPNNTDVRCPGLGPPGRQATGTQSGRRRRARPQHQGAIPPQGMEQLRTPRTTAMTMSIARLSAQSGLKYLFKTTMMDDRLITPADATSYYMKSGTPQGRWIGSGLQGINRAAGDIVTETDAKAVFDHATHPDHGTPLGRPHGQPTDRPGQPWTNRNPPRRRRIRPDLQRPQIRLRPLGPESAQAPKRNPPVPPQRRCCHPAMARSISHPHKSRPERRRPHRYSRSDGGCLRPLGISRRGSAAAHPPRHRQPCPAHH